MVVKKILILFDNHRCIGDTNLALINVLSIEKMSKSFQRKAALKNRTASH